MWLLDALKRIDRENYSRKFFQTLKEKKPGLKFNLWLTLIGVRTIQI